MASTRYGVIIHSEFHKNYLRFDDKKARDAFHVEFATYHASHVHDGECPTFAAIKVSDIPTNEPWNIATPSEVTIDGYKAYEIEQYHQAVDPQGIHGNYKPPTCCVPPLVALNNQLDDLIPADTFQRHELSSVFGDIADAEFQSFKERIKKDGVIENVIKVHDGQILDGWHRYRACKELGILRKLRFQVWDTEKDGDPEVFVLARNLDRRHYSASQRAQIAVHFNERYGHGGDRASRNDRNLKTQQELADEFNVGKRTISDAATVEKLGKSEAVIKGETTTAQVIETAKKGKRACRSELVRMLKETGTIEIEIDDIPKLAEKYQIPRRDVELMPKQVFDDEIRKMRERWQKRYTAVRVEWMDNEALSKNVEWDDFVAAAIERIDMVFLSQETFTEADSRVKDCRDYKLLENEAWSLTDLAAHIRNPSFWVSELIPADIREEAEKAKLWEKIDARLPQWKERLLVENQEVPVENFTKEMLIVAFREYLKNNSVIKIEVGAPGTPLSLAELNKFYDVIRNENYPIIYAVRKALIGETEKPPLQEALDEMKEKQPESATIAERTDALQKQLQKTDIPAWAADVAIEREGEWTLRNLLDHRYMFKHGISRGGSPYFFEELEHLRNLLQSRDPAFIDFLSAQLQAHPLPTDDTETLNAKVKLAIKAWKAKHPGFGYASESMFLAAAKRWHDLPHETLTDADLLDKLLTLLSSSSLTFKRYVKDQLDGKETIFKDKAHTADDDETDPPEILMKSLTAHFNIEYDVDGSSHPRTLLFADSGESSVDATLETLPDELMAALEDFIKSYLEETEKANNV